MIKFKGVSKIYEPDTVALRDISFEIKKGEFVVIAGRSGAGKTTLLKLILVEQRPTKGEIFIEGENINELSSSSLPLLRRKIGAIFQDYKLLPAKTVYENIAFVLKAIGAGDEEIKENVPKVLGIVGLKKQARKFPEQLSSGEKQRAAIGRALIHKPAILLADEPTGNLDPANTQDVVDLLEKINEFGTTVVLATHSREIIKRLKTRTLLLKEGELEMEASEGKVLL